MTGMSGESYAGMVPKMSPDDQRSLLIHVWSLMAHEKWDQAIADLKKVQRIGAAGRMALRTATNMAAMREYRPSVYRALIALFPVDQKNRHYRPVRSKGGFLTVVIRTIEGDHLINPIDDPAAAAQRDVDKLVGPLSKGTALMLCSVSDGYFLEALANRPGAGRDAAAHACAPTYVVEPEPDLLLANLALHDWATPKGPIKCPTMEWIVGERWHHDFASRLKDQWMLQLPGLVLGRKDMHAGLKEAVGAIKTYRREHAIAQRDKAKAHAKSLNPAALSRALRGEAGRPPRLLLLGRSSEGEQIASTEDLRTALHAMGWQTQHLHELAIHHKLSPAVVWKALGEFEPDAVLALDHAWLNRRDVIHANIPVIRFITDAHHAAGQAGEVNHLEPRDFVFSRCNPLDGPPAGFDQRQVIEVPSVVTISAPAQQPPATGPDLLYLGEGADDPRQLLEELLDGITQAPMRLLAQSVGEHMLTQYGQDGCYHTAWEIDQLAHRTAKKIANLKPSRQLYRRVSQSLFYPLNDALYRQQTLRWVKAAADEMSLRFEVHGKGWKKSTEFARHAHGRPISAKLRAKLMQSAKIHIHTPPAFCVDETLLNGTAAGAFYLVRRHPADALLPELGGFLETYCNAAVETSDQARNKVDKRHQDQLETLLDRAKWMSDLGDASGGPSGGGLDPVRCVRACQRAGLIDRHHVALPRLDLTEFEDAAQLKQRIERYVSAPDKRGEIVRKQCTAIGHRLSLSSNLTRAITRMAWLVESER